LAVEVLDEGVGGVGLEADAVVAVDDGAVEDVDGVAAVNVPAVGVLGLFAGGLDGVQVDVGEGDVVGPVD